MRLGHEDVLWVLGGLCHTNRIPFDPKLVLQGFPPPHSDATLIESARALGFRLGRSTVSRDSLDKSKSPTVAFLRVRGGAVTSPPTAADASESGDHHNGDGTPLPRIALILRSDGERLLYFEAGSTKPNSTSWSKVEELFEPDCYLVSLEAKRDASEAEEEPQSFGFSWFARELLKHKGIWRSVLGISLAMQIIGLATPLFTQVIIDKVVVHQTQSTLIVIAIALAFSMVFSAGMSWIRQYLIIHTGNRVDAVLGSEVFWHLLRIVFPYFQTRPTGTLVARLHAVETIREFIAGAAVALILDFPFLVIFLAVMFWYSWQLSLVALLLLTLICIVSAIVTPALRTRLNQQFLLGARNQAFLTEYVSGMETVKSLQMEPKLRTRYDDYLGSYLTAAFSTRQLSNTFNTVVNALEQIMTMSILCIGALLVMRNDGFTVGMLVAFQMFSSRMSQPMMRLAGLWQEFQQANIAVKRLGDILNAPTEPLALVPARMGEAAGTVAVLDLGFRYGDKGPYLYRNLSFELKPGKLTVLTGPSGCGKSTLAKLLLGFYQPVEGQILIDGRDITHYAANELRQGFGVVPQETYLFSGSIYDNLTVACPHATLADVVQACKAAEIHDYVEQLPQGYNTLIGEHGVGLSGGQKQRIAIARAVLRRPMILLFDEATSNLDQDTAEQFSRTVNLLKGNVTMLFIAHQIPSGLQVDEVIRLGAQGARVREKARNGVE